MSAGSTRSRHRASRLVLVLVVSAVALLVLTVVWADTGSEAAPLPGDAAARAGSAAAAPTSEHDEAEAAEPVRLDARDILLTWDPFEPVRVEEPVIDDPDVPPPDPDDPDVPPPPPDPDDPDVTPFCRRQANDVAVCDGVRVRLVEVASVDDEPAAVFAVDGVIHEVSAGDRFADRFELQRIDGACADLSFDGTTVPRLCEPVGVEK